MIGPNPVNKAPSPSSAMDSASLLICSSTEIAQRCSAVCVASLTAGGICQGSTPAPSCPRATASKTPPTNSHAEELRPCRAGGATSCFTSPPSTSCGGAEASSTSNGFVLSTGAAACRLYDARTLLRTEPGRKFCSGCDKLPGGVSLTCSSAVARSRMSRCSLPTSAVRLLQGILRTISNALCLAMPCQAASKALLAACASSASKDLLARDGCQALAVASCLSVASHVETMSAVRVSFSAPLVPSSSQHSSLSAMACKHAARGSSSGASLNSDNCTFAADRWTSSLHTALSKIDTKASLLLSELCEPSSSSAECASARTAGARASSCTS
mmetsp:Transcript_37137/g.87046  ORF Transcript_37137/g.87046 Transcript_37137/m.87046 type:complete len:329 (-) Transcript_37137:441-1427(-)